MSNTVHSNSDQLRGIEAVIPGALAEFLDGTNFITGADDADLASCAARIALETSRSGRGRTRVIRATPIVLDVITRYAGMLLALDEVTRSELRAARTWMEREPELRRQAVVAEREASEQDTTAEAELIEAVEAAERAEALEGTWRGKWIGTEPGQQLTLDGTRPDVQQGNLFR